MTPDTTSDTQFRFPHHTALRAPKNARTEPTSTPHDSERHTSSTVTKYNCSDPGMRLLLCSRRNSAIQHRCTYPYKLALAHLHKFRLLRILPSNNRRHRRMLQTTARPGKCLSRQTVYRQNLELSSHVSLSKGPAAVTRTHMLPGNDSQLQDNPSYWDNYRQTAWRVRKELDGMREWPGFVRRTNFQLQGAAPTRRNHDRELIKGDTSATPLRSQQRQRP